MVSRLKLVHTYLRHGVLPQAGSHLFTSWCLASSWFTPIYVMVALPSLYSLDSLPVINHVYSTVTRTNFFSADLMTNCVLRVGTIIKHWVEIKTSNNKWSFRISYLSSIFNTRYAHLYSFIEYSAESRMIKTGLFLLSKWNLICRLDEFTILFIKLLVGFTTIKELVC